MKITFKEPTGGWYVPFVGGNGQILPKHIMKDFVGAKSREAPLNTKLIGTGPYMVEEFKPGDLVIYKPNPNFRDAAKGLFERIELKGGGDATSAARSVFQTGEFDYSWNLQVEAPVLQDIMNGGKGELVTAPGSGVEQIYFPFMDNTKEANGERGAPGTKHPFLSDIKVREAMALAIDKETMVKQLYGPTGEVTHNVLTTPGNLASKNTKSEFNIEKANKILDDAGYKKGGDGIRMTPDGTRMKVVYPDLDQLAAPEGAGDRQGRLAEDRHRDRAEVGRRGRLLLERPGQPGHLRPVLDGRPDVHVARSTRRSRSAT